MVIWGVFDVSFNSGKKIHSGMAVWGTGVLRIMGKKLRIHGTENIEKGKNYILITNHASLYDIPAVSSFYPKVSWLGRAYLIKIPLFGKILEATDYIPINPGDINETKKVIQLLIQKSESLTVAIFPEGTRTLDGKMQRFRKGFLHLLKGGDLDILPVTLNGFYSLKPKNRFYIDLKPQIEAIIHKPVKKEELMDKSDNEILDQMKRIIETAYRCLYVE
jgi:1-acyl-sn-glycerol-3-phosphate acyltransferase